MLCNPRLVTIFCIVLAAFVDLKPAIACSFHGGFGDVPWSHFEPHSGSGAYSYASPKPSIEKPKITLSLPPTIRAQVKEEKALTVDYSYISTDEAPTMQLLVYVRPGITVEQDAANLVGKSGQHTFMLKPQKSGTYRVLVTARDLSNADAPLVREAVYVNIYN